MRSPKLLVGAVLSLPILLAITCAPEPSVHIPEPDVPEVEAEVIEPLPAVPQTNKKSELAQLMRRLTAHADSVRSRLGTARDLPPYPTDVTAILSATPTDSTLDRRMLSIFAKDYEGKLKGLYAAAPEERTQAYNGMVQSCATCHSTMCPGPLVLIRKMYARQPERTP